MFYLSQMSAVRNWLYHLNFIYRKNPKIKCGNWYFINLQTTSTVSDCELFLMLLKKFNIRLRSFGTIDQFDPVLFSVMDSK